MSTTPVTLPSTLDELKAYTARAIEFYMESPVRKSTKLHNAMVAGLEVASEHALAIATPQAPATDTAPQARHTATFFDDKPGRLVQIDDVFINEVLFDKERVGYRPASPSEMIEFLLDNMPRQSSPHHNDAVNMLNALRELPDTMVWESVSDNEFVAASTSPARFDEVCEEILEANAESFESGTPLLVEAFGDDATDNDIYYKGKALLRGLTSWAACPVQAVRARTRADELKTLLAHANSDKEQATLQAAINTLHTLGDQPVLEEKDSLTFITYDASPVLFRDLADTLYSLHLLAAKEPVKSPIARTVLQALDAEPEAPDRLSQIITNTASRYRVDDDIVEALISDYC